MFAVSVTLTIADDRIESFRELVLRHASRTMESEPGCLRFDVGVDPEDPATFFLYELYESRGAFKIHSESQHLEEFFAVGGDWILSKNAHRWHVLEPSSTSGEHRGQK